MRKISLLIFILLTATGVYAKSISEQQAMQEAQQFMSLHNKNIETSNLKMAFKSPAITNNAENAYYVFNVEGNQGFVIVSGDDRTEPILGYTDNGSYDETQIPENMKSLLQGYADEIDWINKNNVDASKAYTPSTTVVSPLIKSRWNQDEPYNNNCPSLNGARMPTGCVATALAQIMYYHKWPKTATGAIPGYTSYSYGFKMDDLPSTTFAWDDMTDTYSSSSSQASNDAVAQLMLYCGEAVKMNYAPSGSGASVDMIPYALETYFDYSTSAVKLSRFDYSIAQWDSIMLSELTNKRPVFYTGYTSSMEGHAFVCDGYDGKGLFHINWGWGGLADGYFRISVLNAGESGIGGSTTSLKFASYQSAVIGIKAKSDSDVDPASPEARLSTGRQSLENGHSYKRNSASEDFTNVVIHDLLVNNMPNYYDLSAGFGLFNNDNLVKVLYSKGTNFWSGQERDFTSNAISMGANLADGTYKIIPICKMSGNGEWKKDINSDRNYIEAIIKGNDLTLNIMPEADFNVTSAKLNRDIKAGAGDVILNVELENKHSEYNGRVYLFNDAGSMISYETVAIPANSSDSFSFYVLADKKFGANQVFYISTDYYCNDYFYSNGKTANTDMKETISLLNTNEDGTEVYGNKVKVKFISSNKGTGDYFNAIKVRIYSADNGELVLSNDFIGDIPSGTSKQYNMDLSLTANDFDKSYYVMVGHKDGTTDKFTSTPAFKLVRSAIYWSADGKASYDKTAGALSVPDNAVAADLRYTNGDSFTPNGNPNTIYLLLNSVPSSLKGHNVVNEKGNTGKLTLLDGYDYFIPETITANNIYYKRTFTLSDAYKWSTLSLPFSPTKIYGTSVEDTCALHLSKQNSAPGFWVMQLKDMDNNKMNFECTGNIEANTPYLISHNSSVAGKEITFYANAATLQPNAEIETNVGYAQFIGTNSKQDLSSIFVLDNSRNLFSFYSDNVSIEPFRAYVKATNESYSSYIILSPVDLSTGISNVTMPQTTDDETIYSITGQKVGNVNAKQNLPKGIYIIGGKKILIK